MSANATVALLYMIDESELVAMSARLSDCGFQVLPVASLDETARALNDHRVAAAFVEVRAEDAQALAAIRQLRESRPAAPIIVLSSGQELGSRVRARDAGADDYLEVPIAAIDLEMRVGRVHERLLEEDELPIVEEGQSEGAAAESEDAALSKDVQAARRAAREARMETAAVREQMQAQAKRDQEALQRARAMIESLRGAEPSAPPIDPTRAPEVDGLTKLIGSGPMQEHLDREYARCRRYGHALSVLMVDVDRFARYGKKNGPEAGDRVLCLIADVLRSALRSPDIVARSGDDEFVILATDTSEEQALQLAERLRQALQAEGKHTALPVVTVSIGIASSKRFQVKRAEDLLRAAERGVAEAKRAGRDTARVAPS